jgi:hypothetical protein
MRKLSAQYQDCSALSRVQSGSEYDKVVLWGGEGKKVGGVASTESSVDGEAYFSVEYGILLA